MRKSVALVAALLLAAAPSAAFAAKAKSKKHSAQPVAAKHDRSLVGDMLSQIFVPAQSIGHAITPVSTKPVKQAKVHKVRHHRARSHKAKAKRHSA